MTQEEILKRVRELYRSLPRDDERPKSKKYHALVKEIRALTDAYRKAEQKKDDEGR